MRMLVSDQFIKQCYCTYSMCYKLRSGRGERRGRQHSLAKTLRSSSGHPFGFFQSNSIARKGCVPFPGFIYIIHTSKTGFLLLDAQQFLVPPSSSGPPSRPYILIKELIKVFEHWTELSKLLLLTKGIYRCVHLLQFTFELLVQFSLTSFSLTKRDDRSSSSM